MNAQEARVLSSQGKTNKQMEKIYEAIRNITQHGGREHTLTDTMVPSECRDRLRGDGYTVNVINGYVRINW